MKKKASIFVGVHVVHSLSPGDELLINYNFHRPLTGCKKLLALGLPLDIPWSVRKRTLSNYNF